MITRSKRKLGTSRDALIEFLNGNINIDVAYKKIRSLDEFVKIIEEIKNEN